MCAERHKPNPQVGHEITELEFKIMQKNCSPEVYINFM
jgi:hypothetical protein